MGDAFRRRSESVSFLRVYCRAGETTSMPLDDPQAEVHSINMALRKQTHKPDKALSQLFAEELSNEAQELRRAIGLGHVVIASDRARLLLITLYCKRAHRDNWYRFEKRICLYSPGGLITINHGHLNIHEDEVGVIGIGLGDAGLTISSLEDGVARAS